MQELKRLIPYLKRYKYRLYAGLLFVTLSNICSTYIPRVVGLSIDIIKEGNFEQKDILISLITIISLSILSGIFMYLTRQTIIVSSRLIEYDLRNDFLLSIQKQSLDFYNKNSTGILMAHATNDINAARDFLGPAIMYLANAVTTFSFVLYFMISINPSITFFTLLPLPFLTIAVYYIGKKIHIAFKEVQEKYADLTSQSQEVFSGIRVVKSYQREDYESKIFSSLSKDYFKKNLRLARLHSIMMPSIMVIVGLAQIFILGYGGWLVIMKLATLGDITQFFIYVNMLIWPVAAIGWITNVVQRATASLARLGKILDNNEYLENEVSDNKYKDFKISGDIKFQDISLQYVGQNNYALQNINLHIPAGKSIGIIGMVGSGKTSLINLIPALYKSTSGTIYIDDIDINEIPLSILRKSIGYVQQEQFLFSMTIEENIGFGKLGASKEEIINAARIAQLEQEILSFPDAYNTILGERGITLSGGQKQRLAIARAIINNPSIFILDDALSAVDTKTESLILKAIKDFMKNRTTIIISHRISSIKECDIILFLENGKIVESGSHDELLKLNGNYSKIYTYQQLEAEIDIM